MVYMAVWMTGLCNFACCAALAGDLFQLRYGLLPGYPFRVQGIVEEILEETERSNTGAVKITHVFVGPNELLGQTFTATGFHEAAEGTLLDGHCTPKLQRGEVGIWCIYERETGLFGALSARKSVSPRDYQRRLEVAQAKESVADIRSETTQVELLQRYARQGPPTVSSWAIKTLGRAAAKHPDVRGFLRALVDDQGLSIAAQVALDKALVEAVGAAWGRSGRRLQLLEKWVSANLPREDADLVLVRLQAIPQNRQRQAISQESLLRLVKIAAFNEGLPAQSRGNISAILCWVPQKYGNRQAVFDLALEILQRAKAPELELAAARTLCRWLPQELQRHREEVLAVLPSVQSKIAVKLLQEALADKPQ